MKLIEADTLKDWNHLHDPQLEKLGFPYKGARMSYPAIVGAAGLVLVSVFAITDHKHRIKTDSEFSLAQRNGPDPAAAGSTIVDDDKSTVVTGLPTAPEGE